MRLSKAGVACFQKNIFVKLKTNVFIAFKVWITINDRAK